MTNTQPVHLHSNKHPWSDRQRRTLTVLIDLMIPASADGVMPAASELNLYDDVSDMPDDVIARFAAGLSALDAAALETHQQHFDELPVEAAQSVTDAMRAQERSFFNVFAVHNVSRYHRHDKVMPLIGLEVRPPWPQGNDVDQGDWSLLDPVRARAPFYRVP